MSRLILKALEMCGPPLPGVRVNLRLHVGEFFGKNDVWLETEAVRAFVAQLREIEARRQGSAVLSAMSPDECELKLETHDRAGHLRLQVHIQRNRYVGDDHRPTRLAGAFEVDSEDLIGIIASAEGLLIAD